MHGSVQLGDAPELHEPLEIFVGDTGGIEVTGIVGNDLVGCKPTIQHSTVPERQFAGRTPSDRNRRKRWRICVTRIK